MSNCIPQYSVGFNYLSQDPCLRYLLLPPWSSYIKTVSLATNLQITFYWQYDAFHFSTWHSWHLGVIHIHFAFKSLRPRQIGRHFPDNIFKRILLIGNVRTSIEISLRCVPMGPTNTIKALDQIMAWHRPRTAHSRIYTRHSAQMSQFQLCHFANICTGWMKVVNMIIWHHI